ncbi:hypothetical protein C8Q72DRAFT_651795 [Fomitopsis betulina]|nr:hypothetical protein C8Q72DRAFT_651795 [Fomitopsis betulina]
MAIKTLPMSLLLTMTALPHLCCMIRLAPVTCSTCCEALLRIRLAGDPMNGIAIEQGPQSCRQTRRRYPHRLTHHGCCDRSRVPRTWTTSSLCA